MGYDNLYTRLKIKSITGKKMTLSDDSGWDSLPGTDPTGWMPGDTVSVEPMTGKLKPENTYRIKMFVVKNAPVKIQKATDVLATMMTQPVKKSGASVMGRQRTPNPVLDQELRMVESPGRGQMRLEDGWCYQINDLASKVSGNYEGDHLVAIVKAINPKMNSYSIQIKGAPAPLFATLIKD